ncbi:MAG TPA: hypothetical protein VMT91_07450 [Anaerolineales bacterium]|nr:hypothetical protein [Anaerolineales bacterium]
MDPIVIPTLVATAWSVLQPQLAQLAHRAAEEVKKDVPAAASKLWEAIRKKFDAKAAAKEILDELLKNPSDKGIAGTFQRQLKKELEGETSLLLAITIG